MKVNTVIKVKKGRKEAAAMIKNGPTKKNIKLFCQISTLNMVEMIDSFILITWLVYEINIKKYFLEIQISFL